MEHISIFFVIEMIGTVAFASSGAMVAIKKELDLLGVVVLGVTTAVGGGMLRDIILGNVPPALFLNPVYVIAGFLTVLILFTVVRLNQKILESRSIEMYERVMNIFDAVGLGAFTVLQVVLKGILAPVVRDLEGAYSEVSDDKHLLAQGGKSEGKYPSLVLPDHAYDQKGQHHAGQCVAEAARGVPQDVLPFNIVALIQQASCQFVHFILHPAEPLL